MPNAKVSLGSEDVGEIITNKVAFPILYSNFFSIYNKLLSSSIQLGFGINHFKQSWFSM